MGLTSRCLDCPLPETKIERGRADIRTHRWMQSEGGKGRKKLKEVMNINADTGELERGQGACDEV